MNREIVQLTYELCAIPSITKEEVDAAHFLASWLSSQGFLVEKMPVDQRRFNLFAYFEKKPHFNLIYCSHLDTVSPFIEPHIDSVKRKIFGRGTCDAKGIIVAMIHALIEDRQNGFLDNALLITVGEEESSDGAKAANNLLKGRANFLVVGEPTECRAASAQKGSLVFDLVAEGLSAHSSLPHLGTSAIHRLVTDIKRLLDYPWPNDKCFGETFINVGEIYGGSMRNVLAKNAVAKAMMRISKKAQPLIARVKGELGIGVTMHVMSSSDPFFYYVPSGFETFVAGFGSDAPYLKDVGQPILLGPGSLNLAHKSEENIGFDELSEGVKLYRNLANQLRMS